MNEHSFSRLLEAVSLDDWQAVVDGQALLIVDDLRLETGDLNAASSIIKAADGLNAAALKSESLSQAADLLNNYYLTRPLTLIGFNHQATALLQQHGASAFAAQAGYLPQCTLFVEGGEVVAETAESPRHRYGVYCEIEGKLDQTTLESQVNKWLDSGAAHERYLEMNVCRYNC